MKTKLIYSLMLMFLVSLPGRAQGMPVYDNTNFLALGKSLIESAKQTSELLKTVRFLREQKERLEQVSSVVRQLKTVQEIIENNQKLISTVDSDLREILNSPYLNSDEAERIARSFENIIEMALEDVGLMQQLLTSNLLSMSDAERMQILEIQKERSRELLTEVEVRNRRYSEIISFRQFQEHINNRSLNY